MRIQARQHYCIRLTRGNAVMQHQQRRVTAANVFYNDVAHLTLPPLLAFSIPCGSPCARTTRASWQTSGRRHNSMVAYQWRRSRYSEQAPTTAGDRADKKTYTATSPATTYEENSSQRHSAGIPGRGVTLFHANVPASDRIDNDHRDRSLARQRRCRHFILLRDAAPA